MHQTATAVQCLFAIFDFKIGFFTTVCWVRNKRAKLGFLAIIEYFCQNTYYMATSAKASKILSVEEYIEFENQSEVRHEYINGELYAMAGTSTKHNDIVDNIKRLVKDHFRPKGCQVYSENIKLEVIKNEYYPYPDIIMTCDKRDENANFIISHPNLLVEVWSENSYKRDHEFKWRRYKKIPSLQSYLMVSLYEFFAELYTRIGDTVFWKYETFESKEDMVNFEKLGFSISLAQIFQDITFASKDIA